MPVDRLTTQQFADKIRAAILARTRRYDTAYGPILDLIIQPVAAVLEDQNNNRLRRVSLLQSLQNLEEFADSELNALVFNEGIVRPLGARATTTLTFIRAQPFALGEQGRIPRGFPVGTSPDEDTGQMVTFTTTEDRDKTYAVGVIDPLSGDLQYEVSVPAIAIEEGIAGQVGADRVTRPLRGLPGYDSVTNKAPSQQGRDRYTNEELAELYLLAVAARQLSVPTGLEFYLRDTFPQVQDMFEVYGSSPLITRASSDAGAVDAFVIGDSLVTRTDVVPFVGVGQLIQLPLAPLVRVDSVVGVAPSTLYEEGTDYELVEDSRGRSGSVRAREGVRFLPSGAFPSIGAALSITYTYNQLIRDLQSDSEAPETRVLGRDLLFRMGRRIDIFMAARLVVVRGFEQNSVRLLVETAIKDYVNALRLGANVEASDLQGEVRRITGVDNLVITRLARDEATLGVTDLDIQPNEYARLDAVNLNLVLE